MGTQTSLPVEAPTAEKTAVPPAATLMMRMTEHGETGNVLAPLAGLFDKIVVKRVTLEEALAPVAEPQRADLVKRCRLKARQLKDRFPKLSEDQRGVLSAYTAELSPPENSPYWMCNAALREQDRQGAKPWAQFTVLMLSALKALPPAAFDVLFRGYKKSVSELGPNFQTGGVLVLNAFTSVATTAEVMNTFVGETGPRTVIVFQMQRRGRSVCDFSFFPAESEVVLPPGTTFDIQSQASLGNGLTLVSAKQAESVGEIMLLDP